MIRSLIKLGGSGDVPSQGFCFTKWNPYHELGAKCLSADLSVIDVKKLVFWQDQGLMEIVNSGFISHCAPINRIIKDISDIE